MHDLGKTREFTYGAELGLSEEGRLLGHLALGQQLLEPRMAALAPERRLALLHCVLCHHGPEAAPGRRFGSPEALALHRLNALDASVKGALEHGFVPPLVHAPLPQLADAQPARVHDRRDGERSRGRRPGARAPSAPARWRRADRGTPRRRGS